MTKPVRATPLSNHRLLIEFEDGLSGAVDLSGDLSGPVFEPLGDDALFKQVAIDEFGAIVWPNGADLAPDAVYTEILADILADSGARNSDGPQASASGQRRQSGARVSDA